jgi:hypothetical protein
VSWTWLNLSVPEYAEPSRAPEVAGLVYSGLRHAISGPPESLKTVVASILGLTAQREGAHVDTKQGWLVAHIDLEMGARRTRALLRDLGATDHEIRDTHYTEPSAPPNAGDIQYLAGNVDLVILDAAAGAYNVSGLDDNARKDVEAFAAKWIDPLYRAGVATLLIDHVTKTTESRGKWAIGSERKADRQTSISDSSSGSPSAAAEPPPSRCASTKTDQAGFDARTPPSCTSRLTPRPTAWAGSGGLRAAPRRRAAGSGRRSTWNASPGTSRPRAR